MKHINCPSCNESWIGEDIYKFFLNVKNDSNHPNQSLHEYYKNHTDEEILEVASMYGYTLENPKFFEKQIGIEYSELYDGILIYQCESCKNTVGRFSGKINPIPQEEIQYKKSK